MHISLAWWGIILGISAIVLTIPLTIAGNLLTPRVRNWWAALSVNGLIGRIRELEAQLNEMQQYPPLTEVEDMMLSSLLKLDELIAPMFLMILEAVVLLQTYKEHSLAILAIAIIPASVIILMFVRMGALGKYYQFLWRRSPSMRAEMTRQVEQLRKKLDERKQRANHSA